MKNKSKM